MTAISLLVLLVFIHNATPKVYVIDLTKDTDSDDVIELKDLLKLFKKPETINEVELDKKELSKHDDDCLIYLTKADRLECLEKNQRSKDSKVSKSVGREPFYRPNYYHEFYTQRPKRTIYSLYNYYGGPLKTKQPFTDLTRQEFSQDYLDVGELSRKEQCNYPECLTDAPWKQNYKRKLRGIPKGIPKSVRRNNKGDEPVFFEELSRESSDSSEDDRRNNWHDKRHKKRNRFQVVFNGDSSVESEEREIKPHKSLSSESEEDVKKELSSDSESVEVTQKPKIQGKYAYLQGHKLYDSFRRRLQHFLPKRFHWDQDDIQHLGYYWFDGPRGKYP